MWCRQWRCGVNHGDATLTGGSQRCRCRYCRPQGTAHTRCCCAGVPVAPPRQTDRLFSRDSQQTIVCCDKPASGGVSSAPLPAGARAVNGVVADGAAGVAPAAGEGARRTCSTGMERPLEAGSGMNALGPATLRVRSPGSRSMDRRHRSNTPTPPPPHPTPCLVSPPLSASRPPPP